jgi:multiple sugar transport system substrate-binding protein
MLSLFIMVYLSGCLDLSFIAPKEPVTITFWVWDDTSYFESFIEEFSKEYPHITVEFATGWRYFQNDLEDIDVFLASSDELTWLREIDFPMSLNPFISEDDSFELDDFYRSGVDAMSVEGQRWGVPLGADILVMHYNKALFDKYNVPYPYIGWTWDDFLERALALSDPDKGQFGYAYHSRGGIGFVEPMIMMYQWGGGLFDDLQSPQKMTINRMENVPAMQFYADLLHKHHVSPRMGERPPRYPDDGIEGEKYAIWVGSLGDEYEFETGIVPLPQADYAYTMGTIVGLYISNDSISPEASWAWASFLSRKSFPGLLPLRKSLAESDEVATAFGEEVISAGLASLPNLLSLSINFDGPVGRTWGTSVGAYQSALGKIRAGEPVQATLDEAQDKSGF